MRQKVASNGGVWMPIQTFPAPDGSRTLRSHLAVEVVEGLQTLELIGVRQTIYRNSQRKFLSKTEVQEVAGGRWMEVGVWQTVMTKRKGVLAKRFPPKVPASVYEEIRKGNLSGLSIKTVGKGDSVAANGLSTSIEVSREDGPRLTLSEWLRREAVDVELCLPLSREEATAFFEQDVIMGVRHSFLIDLDSDSHRHLVEVTSVGEVWAVLPPNTVVSWDCIVEPHFRICYLNKYHYNRGRQIIHSATPWLN